MRFSIAALPLALLSSPLAAVQADAPPPIAPPVFVPASFPNDPAPANNPGQWVGPQDYPRDELRNNVEGTTYFEVTVSKWGRVVACEIVETSGSPALDEATCAKINENARFVPARDAKGNAIEGTWRNSVRWIIPNRGSIVPYRFTYSFVIEKDGTIDECKIIEGPEGADLSQMPCPAPTGFGPQVDEEGNPIRRKVTMTTGMSFEDLPDE